MMKEIEKKQTTPEKKRIIHTVTAAHFNDHRREIGCLYVVV